MTNIDDNTTSGDIPAVSAMISADLSTPVLTLERSCAEPAERCWCFCHAAQGAGVVFRYSDAANAVQDALLIDLFHEATVEVDLLRQVITRFVDAEHAHRAALAADHGAELDAARDLIAARRDHAWEALVAEVSHG